MPTKQTVKYLIYALVILLSLIVLTFVVLAPPGFTDIKNAYQQF